MKNYIIIYGPQGSGKSQYARELAKAKIRNASPIFFASSTEHPVMDLPKGTQVVIFDDLFECSLLAYHIEFRSEGEVIHPICIMCVQQDRPFRLFRENTTYIRMPDKTIQSVETIKYKP